MTQDIGNMIMTRNNIGNKFVTRGDQLRTLILFLMITLGTGTVWGQTTYQYYCLHVNNKGYMRQCKGVVNNDGTFRYENAYDGNGYSIWVYSSEGYLQNEMYYLNVLNGQTLVLSTTPETKWDLVDDGSKKRFQMQGSTKVLGLNSSKAVVLAEAPTDKYAACTLKITEEGGKWDGPKDKDFTVQSPQVVTWLRTYYIRNITVTIDKNDAGAENSKVVDKKDSRCYCMRTYDPTQAAPTGKGTNWDINTTTGVIYNMVSSNQAVTATYSVAPLNPIVRATHPATEQSCKITVTSKAFSPTTKKYLLFNTQDDNYRFPYANTSLSEGDLLPVNGKASDLTEAINEDLSWDIEVDTEGYYSFKNVATNRYLYYDAADYSVSDHGAVKIGSTAPGSDTRYKFRLFSGGVNITPFGGSYYIIPYNKQFAVYKSDATIEEMFFALYMNTSNLTKIASLTKASDPAKWKLYTYEWQDRLWTNYTINGDKDIYTADNYNYTATTWFSRNIKDSPTNTEYCLLNGSKTKTGISYAWQFTGLDDYVNMPDDVEVDGTSTLTATFTLPPGTRTGTLKVTASITSPAKLSNDTSIPITLYNLNPTFTEINSLSEITDANGLYKLTGNNTYSASNKPNVETVCGTFDGGNYTITGLTSPLFKTIDGGTVRNLNLDNITISSGGTTVSVNGESKNVTGAIANVATGSTRIYNCGVLATNSTVTTDENGYTHIATNSSAVSGVDYVGGLVGLLDGEARVINCFSYADITGGDEVGGIVGHNNVATTSANLKTMVMNCMFYGDITGGTSKAPIYNGKIITNIGDKNGLGNYNYFRAEASYVQNRNINVYNCALMAETRFLQRFEFFRHILNGHRELAAWWATGDAANKDKMMKWVIEPSQIGTNTPYPILKEPGYYPSVVNIDAEHATVQSERNKGGLLGTLTVNIRMGSGNTLFTPALPNGAEITTSQVTLNITDKDPDHFNFNYGKVQLPFYNDVGTKNYNDNRVVTGWKIVKINGSETGTGTFTATGSDVTYDSAGNIATMPFNFADRTCTNKDIYSVSGRVFNQGAYWDVPEDVTDITIEPYWAKAAYVADGYADVVYNTGMGTAYNVPTVGGGELYTNGDSRNINGQEQIVYTSISNALGTTALNPNTSNKTYDYAIVLVGNYHQLNNIEGSKPYTVMSADLDGDNEPDYSFILRFNGRTAFHPVRYDFLNLVGLGMAQKSTGGTGTYNFGIMQPKDWFEVTNTALFRVTQFEYSPTSRSNTNKKPIILQGGVIEQWVCLQGNPGDRVSYFHVGGNVWFKEFHLGIHQDNGEATPHPPVSVTGGDFGLFYLTGAYRANVTIYDDCAEAYISGGRFSTVAGTGMEGLGTTIGSKGNITWQIDHADIDEFYGGGINAVHPAIGNIYTIIRNSHVRQFCGGPKFGDMTKTTTYTATVTTNATNCTFGTFFGAGYGGTSYSRLAPKNYDTMGANATWGFGNMDWNSWVNGTTSKDNYGGYKQDYNSDRGGVSTQIDYQFLPMSSNETNVMRIFLDYASFSLATTHYVTSNLTNCTITGNFYGGGSLGKVDGPVASTLTNCTVNGSVFGAGFSASIPTVEVMNTGGFPTPPYYDYNLGTYLPAVFPATVTYTWQHAETVNSTATAIDKTNHILYTTEDLSHTNLGSVAGNATLTLSGTTVAGSVYGGGDESATTGNTTVTIQDSSHITGDVFGGGNNGNVGGSTTVNIKN